MKNKILYAIVLLTIILAGMVILGQTGPRHDWNPAPHPERSLQQGWTPR